MDINSKDSTDVLFARELVVGHKKSSKRTDGGQFLARVDERLARAMIPTCASRGAAAKQQFAKQQAKPRHGRKQRVYSNGLRIQLIINHYQSHSLQVKR